MPHNPLYGDVVRPFFVGVVLICGLAVVNPDLRPIVVVPIVTLFVVDRLARMKE